MGVKRMMLNSAGGGVPRHVKGMAVRNEILTFAGVVHPLAQGGEELLVPAILYQYFHTLYLRRDCQN